jgi:hypothetical protein
MEFASGVWFLERFGFPGKRLDVTKADSSGSVVVKRETRMRDAGSSHELSDITRGLTSRVGRQMLSHICVAWICSSS